METTGPKLIDVNDYAREVILAATIYYHVPSLQSPLSDEEFDARVEYICKNWDELKLGFKEYFEGPVYLSTTTYFINALQEIEEW